MTALLVVLTVLALVVYGLERNHHRDARLGSRLAGSHDVEDRDLARVRTELHAVREAAVADRPRAKTPLTVRSVSAGCVGDVCAGVRAQT
ncbi:hypothetical protein ABZ816_10465 [Actinosynnema sp. NPDC047251]|uniref:Uncharacterized protein n=1 Tax=Saccharothrix espanaensis (strain ATCC 51144 / DSM 44229 / JCM 9112 / NBRC 15066 / NRRL 15764) TaxID=1179773 RepID=K0K7B1_SACES|nr:hypothetical protein [Saccharothrix espanaensis]CCH34236.1 hypothetical protein BN6_70000 [Saccharothrix espanaensis DSM 44229]